MGKKTIIVDSSGQPINGKYDNEIKKIKKYIISNLWNVLVSITNILGILTSVVISISYSRNCSEYYGVDEKYFDGISIFQDKIIFLVIAIIVMEYPFLFHHLKCESKIFTVFMFLLTILILFTQNMMYTEYLIKKIKLEWLTHIIGSWAVVIIFLTSDILLSYFLIVRNCFRKDKSLKKLEKTVFKLALVIYLINISVGISVGLNRQISDKRLYEVIDNNKVVITNYDGKFLVMDCNVQGETLYIKKGKYSFIEMTDVDIKYNEYKDVQCK